MKILYPTHDELVSAAAILKEERGTSLPSETSPAYASLVTAKAMEILESKTTKAPNYDFVEIQEDNIIPTAKAFRKALETEQSNIVPPESEAKKIATYEALEEIFNKDGKITDGILIKARNVFIDQNKEHTGLIGYDFQKKLEIYRIARRLADETTQS